MRKTNTVIYRKASKAALQATLLMLLLLFSPIVCAVPIDEYTQERPLIIVSDWEFPPYEFNNSYGVPSGFNIEVLQNILTKLHIPHKFIMKEWVKATELFEKHEADLILDPVSFYNKEPYYSSRSILNYYKIKIASNRKTPPIKSLEQLKTAKGVVLKSNDIASRKVIEDMISDLRHDEHSVKEALAGLVTGQFLYFIWGEEPLKWKIKELNLQESIMLNELDIPAGEIHFVGYNPKLIELLDDQYARMEQNGDLDHINDKWFHPELVHNDTSPIAIFITLGVLTLAIALYLLNRLIRRRVVAATRKSDELENMMTQALHMGEYSIIEYDTRLDHFTNNNGNMMPPQGLNMQQFLARIHPEKREATLREMQKLKNGENTVWEMKTQWNAGTSEQPNWQHFHGHALAEKDETGSTRYIVCALKNVTNEYEQEQKDEELASKYIKIFDSTLVAMSFYDKQGKMVALNRNMRKLYGIYEENEKKYFEESMFDIPPLYGDFDPLSRDCFNVCQHMHFPEKGFDKYVETRIQPVYEGNDLQYYVVTARDVTDERAMYIEQQLHDKELHEASTTIRHYEKELLYLLENCQMWVWRSDLSKRIITFSRSLRGDEHGFPFEDFLDFMYDEENKAIAMKAFSNMKGTEDNFNITLHYRKSPTKVEPMWVAISGIPVYNEDGKLKGHYGVLRDVTALMEAQEKLKIETSRAEDSGKLKSMFLANMTHEIRTPLNAIVGFSDLLQVIDDPTERREFIRIIRTNCDMLIRLINDIIEASNTSQDALAIDAEDVDFAKAFNDISQTLAQRVKKDNVEFIVDNPYQTFCTHIDKGRLQQVITNFTTNAVKYTHQGHIKIGYRYEDAGIYMYCEDTGTGIPKDKQAAVFDRFVKLNDYVQGTGLGLSICKSIANRCGGRIGVNSEGEGHGSTFWIWIPCEMKSMPLKDNPYNESTHDE